MKPVFSIIIATYNSEKYLSRTLDSIIAQNFLNYEILIIDGGSKDRTLAIVEQYKNKIAIVISEKDDGIYDAWNKGVNVATGDWISFLGSDDVFYPDCLMNYYQYIQANHGLEYVSSKVNLLNMDGSMLRTIGKPWDWKSFRRYMCVAHVGSMHKSTLYERYGFYDRLYKTAGDYEFLLRSRENLKTGFLDKITVGMQVGGVSTNFSAYKETYRAKITTGNVPKAIALYDWLIAFGIFYGRKILKL